MPNENGSPRLDRIERAIENLSVNIESLHASVSELHGIAQEQGRTMANLITASERDAENIRALARIAEIHERRLTDLESGDDQ